MIDAARSGSEDLYALARAAYADPTPAMRAAAEVRDAHFGPRVTYSRKVFIPLTKLCRDNCGYCTFAHPPRPGERAYLTLEEVLGIARSGAEAGCKEALFTLGDKPEKRYPEARRELWEMGFGSTVEYLVYACGLILDETGLLLHANPGCSPKRKSLTSGVSRSRRGSYPSKAPTVCSGRTWTTRPPRTRRQPNAWGQ